MRGTRGLRGVAGRSIGTEHGGYGGRGSGPAPVLMKITDPALVDEVAMIVTVTGRRLVREDEIAGVPGLVVVTDAPATHAPVVEGACADPRAVRVIRVSGDPVVASSGPDTGAGEVLQIPEAAHQLAAAIGCHDPCDIAVAGVVGGAGSSVFAAALAGAVAGDGDDGPGQSLLVDEDPLSRPGHLRLLLGAEGDGHVGPVGQTGADTVGEPEVAWVDDVGVAETRGSVGSGDPEYAATPSRPVVRDCGRRDLAGVPEDVTHRVLVVPQSVPAVLAARHAVQTGSGIHVVLRELPRSGLTWNQTLSLLGRAPAVTWEDDPFLTVDIDRGDFRTTGGGAGTAGVAAARLLELIR
ncbi:hypothetical protein [Corynebacterium sp.]|uniref:hypothetical protein n=1 Tax=Corynebacterium sp. TaxID=1720 RepID=UPI003B3BB977